MPIKDRGISSCSQHRLQLIDEIAEMGMASFARVYPPREAHTRLIGADLDDTSPCIGRSKIWSSGILKRPGPKTPDYLFGHRDILAACESLFLPPSFRYWPGVPPKNPIRTS